MTRPARVHAGTAARPLVLVGAGGFARETAAAVDALVRAGHRWHLLGLLDDDPRRHGTHVDGVPVLGPAEAIADHPDATVVLATGHPGDYASRLRIADRLGLDDDRYATLVHPGADVGTGCTIGPGTVVLAQTVLTAAVRIGRHAAVMPQVVLTHDVEVGDFATLASGVRLGGGTRVGTGAYLGSGALVRERVRVGPWSMVGMGSVVTRDVPAGRLWFGSPARDVRPAPGADLAIGLGGGR